VTGHHGDLLMAFQHIAALERTVAAQDKTIAALEAQIAAMTSVITSQREALALWQTARERA
jgi:uncharacterized coiled-coil protein SlyX